jgi:hypothetical protein
MVSISRLVVELRAWQDLVVAIVVVEGFAKRK